MSWVAVAGAAIGVIGGAVTANNNKPKAPPARDLGGELNALGSQYPQTLDQFLQGATGYNSFSLNNLNTLSRGEFDSNKFFEANPDANQQWQDHFTNGELQGWTPEQFAKAYLEYNHSASSPQSVSQQLGSYNSGGIPELSSQLNTQSRGANLADAQRFGQQYVDLTRGANSDYYGALNSFTAAAQQTPANSISAQQGSPLLSQLNQRAMNAGPSELQTQQNGIASQLLSQGGNLSASDLRNVQQNSRSGFAARGLDATNASVADEVLQTDAAQRNRLLQNLGIAQSVQNQGLAEQNQQNQFGLGVSGQNFGYGQLDLQGQALAEQQRQAQLGAQAQAVQLQGQHYLDPYAAVIGSADQNLLNQILGMNQSNLGTQGNLYGSLLGYGGDLNNTNYNANAAANIAGSNQNAALYGSLIQAGGNVAGAYMSQPKKS